jgi:kynurenine formamidase
MTILPDEQIRDGVVGIADDVLVLPLQAATQWDSLAHFSHKGLLYGGRPASLVTSAGTAANDVRNFSSKLATRGVLIDVARARHVASLEPGDAIEAGELDEILAATETEVGEGDVVLVRTGHLQRCRSRRWEGFAGDAPGLGMTTLEWLHERRVAAVATDTYAVEAKPYQVKGHASPFHVVAIVYMGLLLGEIFDLEQLAVDCASDRRYDFFFVGAGLPVTAAVGTPVNPYAIR